MIIGLTFRDGSDLDYITMYNVPSDIPGQVIATLSAIYESLDEEEDSRKYNLNFEEWLLDSTGIVITPIEPDEEYDAFTGKPI